MKNNIGWCILSVVLFSIIWAAWVFFEDWVMAYVVRMDWGDVLGMPFLGWLIAIIFDQIVSFIVMFLAPRTYPSLSPFYWAWLPTLTLGLLAVAWPWIYLYTTPLEEPIGFANIVISIEMSFFPILNIISIIRIVKQQ